MSLTFLHYNKSGNSAEVPYFRINAIKCTLILNSKSDTSVSFLYIYFFSIYIIFILGFYLIKKAADKLDMISKALR